MTSQQSPLGFLVEQLCVVLRFCTLCPAWTILCPLWNMEICWYPAELCFQDVTLGEKGPGCCRCLHSQREKKILYWDALKDLRM